MLWYDVSHPTVALTLRARVPPHLQHAAEEVIHLDELVVGTGCRRLLLLAARGRLLVATEPLTGAPPLKVYLCFKSSTASVLGALCQGKWI